MDLVKKPIVFALDNLISLKGKKPFNLLFKDFPHKVISLNLALNENTENKFTIQYVKVFDSEVVYRSSPKTIEPKIHKKFKGMEKYSIRERFVLKLKNARVLLSECFVITANGNIIEEINPLMGRFTSKIFQYFKLPKVKKISGSVAVLSNNDNYFHWMFETIPRILLLKKFNQITNSTTNLYVIGNDEKFKKESIKKIGLKDEQLISADKNLHLLVDNLIVPSMPINSGNPTNAVCDFLRKTFLEKPSIAQLKKYKRIYVSRGDVKKRKVANESKVMDFLSKFGFTKVVLNNLSIAEQSKIFNSAEVIVAPHGAALSNLVFCKKNTKVIEIFHPDYVNVCFWALSNCMKLDYFYFIGGKKGIVNLDLSFDISLEKLRKTLKLAKID
jgi:hypothetical protein